MMLPYIRELRQSVIPHKGYPKVVYRQLPSGLIYKTEKTTLKMLVSNTFILYSICSQKKDVAACSTKHIF